jgi:hypothetical protein
VDVRRECGFLLDQRDQPLVAVGPGAIVTHSQSGSDFDNSYTMAFRLTACSKVSFALLGLGVVPLTIHWNLSAHHCDGVLWSSLEQSVAPTGLFHYFGLLVS